MQGSKTSAFTHDHVVREDGSVAFACSQDGKRWPWSLLHPHHPGAIQALSYWVSVESAMALGKWDPDKWSALTWTRWECGGPEVGRIAHGTYERSTIEGKESFSIYLYDAEDALVCRLDGRGVVFRTRDFEKWRQPDKEAAPKALSDTFAFADDRLLGIAPGERPFLAPLKGDTATALIDRANGMPPGHPWLDGSGDHVNSAHLAEAARQFACLFNGGQPCRVVWAEMAFRHYVELGSPFEIAKIDGPQPGDIAMQVTQAGHACTSIRYRVETALPA